MVAAEQTLLLRKIKNIFLSSENIFLFVFWEGSYQKKKYETAGGENNYWW